MEDAGLPDPHGAPSVGEPYQSLYRRYRPQRFSEVRGQEHVTRALRNAVRDGRVAHAYLFSGPRGTGKTSTARILAMALNCEHVVDGEPDGTCESCVEIRRGASVDVHELDAASNRKLDEMRDLLGRVALGTRGRWKVYIIDEVHQLTADAASALLKTLEEPPAHVVFVLATTDPQKVLPTIRSRTQSYEFRLLPSDTLGELLRDVNHRAGLGVAPEAIELVVRRGHGSARDALSVLDQVAAAGIVEDEATVVADVIDALADRDPARVLVAVAEGMSAGRDARRLAADILEHLRNGFLATQARGLVMLADDALVQVEEQARRLGVPALVRAMEILGQALADMRDSVDPRISLEVALVRLASPEADNSPAALLERIERLERQLDASGGGFGVASLSGRPAGPGGAAPAAVAAAARAEEAVGVRPSVGEAEEVGSAAGEVAPPAPPGPVGGVVPAPAVGAPAGRESVGDAPPGREPAAPRGPQPSTPARQAAGKPGSDQAAGPEPSRAESPAAAARAALGAHRRQPATPATPATPSSRPVEPPPLPPTRRPAPAGAEGPSGREPAAAPPVTPVAGAVAAGGVGSPGAAAVGDATSPAPGTGAIGGEGGPGAPRPGGSASPDRDQLTKAWGDSVLSKLSGRAKAFLGAGRFVGVEGEVATFALPDPPLLGRAEQVKAEAESALSDFFRSPVRLSLVLDTVAAPLDRPAPPADPEDDSLVIDLTELEDADPGLSSPEQRLFEAFPGAEEVTP